MGSAFKLGFLTHLDGAGKDEGTLLKELFDVFTAAEAFGFDGGWVAQHHVRADYGRRASPMVSFGALASRLPRFRLGTAMIVLPMENLTPDSSSHGAFELGLGTGGPNEAFGVFGLDPANRRALFDERLGALRSALQGEPKPGGDHILRPPAPTADGRLWQSTGDLERAAVIGEVGDGLLLGTAGHDPYTGQRPLANAYLSGARRPRFGIVRTVFPAEDRKAARDELVSAVAVHRENLTRRGLTDVAALSTEEYLDRLNVHRGTTSEVIESLYADPALLGYLNADSWFLPVVRHGHSAAEPAIERLRLIATEIAPALGWRRT
jgi:alkanesulfonate monooxygenase SsuD/methylene tetrahydromethanopterin reductase-like flavin-dependent oxidoreductase (luciferase family)